MKSSSFWRRSPRAKRARIDLLVAFAIVGGLCAAALSTDAAAPLREAVRQAPLTTAGVLSVVVAAPACGVLWCLSRRRRDAERLIAYLRIRRAASRWRDELSNSPSHRGAKGGADRTRAVASLEATTAISIVIGAGLTAGHERALREANEALATSIDDRPGLSPETESVDLVQLLDGLSGSIRTVVEPGAPQSWRVDARLLTALIENLAAVDRFAAEPPLVEVASSRDGLSLTIARRHTPQDTVALANLRQHAARLMGGHLSSLLKEDDIVVERLFLPAPAVAAAPLRYSAAAS